MTVLLWAGVAVLGGAGAVARHLLATAVAARTRAERPAGILVVNVLGAFALGVLTGAGVSGDALLLAGGGLLGAFTTFSTWMHDAHTAGPRGGARAVAGALVLGLAAAALGRLAGAG